MYTPEMATAFKAIVPPKNFGLTIYDNDNFVTLEINPKDLVDLLDEDKTAVVKYINDVKSILEELGAIVFIVREALESNVD
jgi:hypothetical protein